MVLWGLNYAPAHHRHPCFPLILTCKHLFFSFLVSRIPRTSRFPPCFPCFLFLSYSFSQVYRDGPLWQYGGGARARPPRAARANGDATQGETHRGRHILLLGALLTVGGSTQYWDWDIQCSEIQCTLGETERDGDATKGGRYSNQFSVRHLHMYWKDV